MTQGYPLYQGASQPEYRAFMIDQLDLGAERCPVVTTSPLHTPFFTLRAFTPEDVRPDISVLVVPPLSGHFPILIRDLVLGLLRGFLVVVLDWANVRHVAPTHGVFAFDDNIQAVADAIRCLGSRLAVVALCQGAIPALAAVADLAAHDPHAAPASLILIAAPIDPMANPTAIVRLIRKMPRAWFASAPLSRVSPDHEGRDRRVYPAELQLQALLRYLSRGRRGDTDLAQKIEVDDGCDPGRFPFVDLYTSIMDLDAAQFVENIDHVFLQRDLVHGTLRYSGRAIYPETIRQTSLFTIEGESDMVAAPGQTTAAHDLCRGLPNRLRQSLVVPGCGHFSLFHGTTCGRVVVPQILRHLESRCA